MDILGILILVLHRRADHHVHEKIEELYKYVTTVENELISKIHQMIEKEQSLDNNIHKMVENQSNLIEELHASNMAEDKRHEISSKSHSNPAGIVRNPGNDDIQYD
jgi:hypothetical protein